ncbi:winged helix-turn-helix domain-containing protein [Micromonospora sp. NBC_01796]|uniref:winged helix-turn-helix domain-containing protein n=1 Tax=Micromonospora sp. NBC_01796 TaxID=2975987 RepID=UPI002DDC81F2|nr:winged helix-turn-helix domain-containing protein [Micromonospora sp. NBC_01796]WSA85341.1 winged helix-turn-helix domain-containing protein [Micromonospora sp. NBC_01796]
MSVIAISPRTYPPSSGSVRSTLGRRRIEPGNAPTTLTVTLDITLSGGDTLTPQASRLLELVQQLVEQGDRAAIAGAPGAIGLVVEPAPARVWGEEADAAVQDAVPLRILAGSRKVLRGGAPIPLTRLEYDLLVFLAEHPRRVFTRLQLLNSVWGYEHAVARTVDVHVRRLRAKVGETVPLVTTVYGVGYRLADEARISLDRDA